MYPNASCENCGKSYRKQRSTSRYCSSKCRVEANRKAKNKFEKIKVAHWDARELRRNCLVAWDYEIYDQAGKWSLLYIQLYQEDKPQLFLIKKDTVKEFWAMNEKYQQFLNTDPIRYD